MSIGIQILRRLPLLLLAYIVIVMAVTVVQVATLRVHNPQTTAWMRMRVREAAAAGKELPIKHEWIALDKMSRYLPRAAVAAEDQKFFEHAGFDWEAIRAARERNEQTGRVKRGGSTITQQLAKNLFLSPRRSYIRKGREAVLTVLMEWLLPKERILELYLNSIEFGPGVFGVEAGARHHFGMSAAKLSAQQAGLLAAIIPSPRRYKITGPYVQRRGAAITRMIGGAPPDTAGNSRQVDLN